MSEASRDLAASSENARIGPDYFSFCAREVALLLSQDEDFVPFVSQTSELSRTSGVRKDKDVTEHHLNGKEANTLPGCDHLFSNSIGSGLSDIKRERLKAMLNQGVFALSQEVDEIMDPVVALHQIRTHLQYKQHQSSHLGTSDGDGEKFPCKKQKRSSSSSTSVPVHASPVDVEARREKREPPLCSSMGTEKENEVNADLLFLIENQTLYVVETMKKYSDELSATLKHMEQQLEELLDTVMSTCRPMTLTERQKLRNRIQKLPLRNLDRIVEIISKPDEAQNSDEIHVDLEIVDNITLWRLYYYIEAIKSARKGSL